MLRLKQNTYPVMFLTQGVTIRYPSYHDLRCNSIPAAIYHSLSSSLLGIVVHTEDLLRDSTQVNHIIFTNNNWKFVSVLRCIIATILISFFRLN